MSERKSLIQKAKEQKIFFPILSVLFALTGTAALFLGMPLSWLAALVGANVFLAAGMVCGTEVKTIRRKNPMARFSEEEPEELEGKMYRVPFLSVILALLAALVAGLITKSAVAGLLIFFTWGGAGVALALCVLSRSPFGQSLQTGLISAVGVTGIAGAIQVLISSPGNSFDVKYCLTALQTKIQTGFFAALNEAKALLEAQPELYGKAYDFSALFGTASPEETATLLAETIVAMLPALFAIGMLALLCVIWWLMKATLKRTVAVDVKDMGRIDGYRPGPLVSPLYFLFMILSLFGKSGSVLQILGMNMTSILSAVLMFAGFSLILYIINSRISSPVARVFLTIGAVFAGLSSLGSSLLLLLGMISAGTDLRGRFGGGSLQ